MIWGHTRRASRLFFFAFLIFAFLPFPIARLQDPPRGVLFRNLRRGGTFSVSLQGQTRTRRAASWLLPFGKWNRLSGHVPQTGCPLSRWAADRLSPTRTIQSTTSPRVQSGSNPSPVTAQQISLVATFRMLTSPLSSSPIDWTIPNTFSSRDGAPRGSVSQPFKKLSSKTFNLPRRASPLGHLVSEPSSRSYCGSTGFSGARLSFTSNFPLVLMVYL
jgi:hypothetical protein